MFGLHLTIQLLRNAQPGRGVLDAGPTMHSVQTYPDVIYSRLTVSSATAAGLPEPVSTLTYRSFATICSSVLRCPATVA